jgi:hypothetical protein
VTGMQLRLLFAALFALTGQCLAQAPAAVPPTAHVSKGLPVRATPAEYLSRATAGAYTIAAEFDRHDVPTAETTLTTEDYVCVEVAVFGPAGSHVSLSFSDFSLRINGKKSPIPAEQFAAVSRNLRDPTYEAPEVKAAKENKSSGLNAGGGDNGQGDAGNTPPVIHIPPEMERAMELQVQNAALPEGERTLPVAGLVFCKYGGQPKGIHSVELVYAGAAGKATVTLQP